MFKFLCLFLIPLCFLSGCASIHDVRARPPIISQTANKDYKNLAGCFEEKHIERTGNVSALKRVESGEKVSLIAVTNHSAYSTVAHWEAQFINAGKNKTDIIVYPENSLARNYTHRIIREIIAECS